MNNPRYNELMADPDGCITEEEMLEGWHWCPEFDYLLVGKEMREWEFCLCDIKKQIENQDE